MYRRVFYWLTMLVCATSAPASVGVASDAQKQKMERWCIMQDLPSCAYNPGKPKTTKKVASPTQPKQPSRTGETVGGARGH